MPFLTPPETFAAFHKGGVAKTQKAIPQMIVGGILAGFYIGMGVFLVLSVGGAVPAIKSTDPGVQRALAGSFGLPFGLTMVVLFGADLFTGNTAMVGAALLEKKVDLLALAKSWCISWSTNFAGSLLLMGLVVATDLFAEGNPSRTGTIALAESKTSKDFGEMFCRGILCNILVCMALWQQTAAQDVGGKILAIFLPIMAFIACSFDHSVANMFLIPLGMALGADVNVGEFLWKNLIPVTLGNIVGGFGFVGLPSAFLYGNFLKSPPPPLDDLKQTTSALTADPLPPLVSQQRHPPTAVFPVVPTHPAPVNGHAPGFPMAS